MALLCQQAWLITRCRRDGDGVATAAGVANAGCGR